MYETQLVRHTTMIVGPTGGGKTLVLETLKNSRLIAENIVVKMYVLNPKAQPLNELYGEMDPVTRDWTGSTYTMSSCRDFYINMLFLKLSQVFENSFSVRFFSHIMLTPIIPLSPSLSPSPVTSDGILSKLFRELNDRLPPGKENEMRWIVFDGDVDALWVENMNSGTCVCTDMLCVLLYFSSVFIFLFCNEISYRM
jgi:dynein heavy chain, axonemal